MERCVTALFTYDVPHYRVLRAAASENFDDVAYTRWKRAIAFRIGEGNFHSTEGDICSRSLVVELGFYDVGTFLPFILELNGFSRLS